MRRRSGLAIAAAIALAAMPASAQGDAAGAEARTHTVQSGETLWHIAKKTVGDGRLWPALYEANRDQIKDPSRVYPGQELSIPEIGAEQAEELRRETPALATQ